MTVRAILAHDSFWGIGKNGDLPWPKNKEDLQWFKEQTVRSTVVMGRNTWESLPFKPLPQRRNIVVTQRNIDGVETLSIDDLKENVSSLGSSVWIIGGSQLIEHTLDIIDEILLNNVEGVYDCDIFLPKKKITELFHPASTEKKSFGLVTRWIKR